MIDDMREQLALMVAAKKRVQQPRYLRPEVVKFINNHPLSSEQPKLPRLSKGKGVGTKQMISVYIYGYFGKHCGKAVNQIYKLDQELKDLILSLQGVERDTLSFRETPNLVTSTMYPKVAALAADITTYEQVLKYFV
jgi:hypothetical protein